VSEFIARVNNRFEPGKAIVTQPCDKEVMYEPADYHLVINTLPPTTRYVPLEFDAITTLRIDEPGFVHFTNTDAKGNVELFYPLGDQYLKFYTIPITGEPAKQKLRLQPGIYEAHYSVYGADKKETFRVKSNAITEIKLP